MSKKLQDLKWESVALEGFPVGASDKLHGFVGLEECTDYGFDKETKKGRKQKREKKRKQKTDKSENDIPNKKIKLSNGFIVENCNSAAPSLNNENIASNSNNSKRSNKKQKKNTPNTPKMKVEPQKEVKTVKKKTKLGEDISQKICDLTPEDMLTWAEFKLPEPILKSLAELGFKKPTKIQQLTLPAAIHGRRDILGAAETGSGKTLAFGLPILTGIMKLKEKAAMGHDPYDIPYKKSSNKKPQVTEDNKAKNKNKSKKPNLKDKKENVAKKKEDKKQKNAPKESSEDGYSSGEESTEETQVTKKEAKKTVAKKKPQKIKTKKKAEDNEFLEEFDVPIRKRKVASEDEGNDSDDENYVHLSDLLDSDDLGDSGSDNSEEEISDDGNQADSDEEGIEVQNSDDDGQSDEEIEGSDAEDDESDAEDSNVDEDLEIDDENQSGSDEDNSGDEALSENDDEEGVESAEGSDDEENVDENQAGIGCVKVIDDIELPGQVAAKTGKPLYALILTPTRELAIQISRHLVAAAKYTGIRIATIVGGMAPVKQERLLRCGPEVVVATPGRLWELISQGQPHLQQLQYLKFLAIDETDRMIERGHFEELQPLLERINSDEDRKGTRQNFVFSATLTLVHELPSHMQGKKVTKRGKILNRKVEKMTPQLKVKRLVQMIGMTDPKVVDITQSNLGTAETLTESKIACPFEQKDAHLYYILKRHPGRTIVFCNSISSVKRLAQLLTILKCRPLPLHANMQQKQRLKNLERFRDDRQGVLIATDVAARGLDIPDVDHVIHYQVPRTAENYVHRSGRTARATKEGLTILMMEPTEAYNYVKLCRTLNKTTEPPSFPVPPALLAPFKDIVSLARDIEVLEMKRRRAAQASGWREKVAKEMDIIIDEDDVPITKTDTSLEKTIKVKKRQLDSMLTRPMFPKGFSYKYPTLNDPLAVTWSEDNALEVMKNAIQSGELKKEKRKGKNASLLKLQKTLKKA